MDENTQAGDAVLPTSGIVESKFRVAEVVAEQIWREQQLVTARMTWNLTFQGFLLTAFAWTYGADAPQPTKVLLQIGILVPGIIVPIATYCSIYASQLQRDHMKDKWNALYGTSDESHDYPRPYSDTRVSRLGRVAPAATVLALLIMWGFLVRATYLAYKTPYERSPTKIVLASPIQKVPVELLRPDDGTNQASHGIGQTRIHRHHRRRN